MIQRYTTDLHYNKTKTQDNKRHHCNRDNSSNIRSFPLIGFSLDTLFRTYLLRDYYSKDLLVRLMPHWHGYYIVTRTFV